MNLFRRLFAPEIDTLRSELTQIRSERDWFREQCGELVKKREAEQRRNLKREDSLLAQIVRQSGGLVPPARFEEVKVDEKPSSGLTPAEESTLRARAREILEQHSGGEMVTNADIEAAYQRMLENADHYLTD